VFHGGLADAPRLTRKARSAFAPKGLEDPGPGLNGAKIIGADGDGSCPKRAAGIQPGFHPRTRHRLEAYATLLSGVSSDLSKCFLRGVSRAHRYHATVLVCICSFSFDDSIVKYRFASAFIPLREQGRFDYSLVPE
jgi:hypothetical protein